MCGWVCTCYSERECVHVCVSKRERERERKKKRERERDWRAFLPGTHRKINQFKKVQILGLLY
jgi:hypothetical protein